MNATYSSDQQIEVRKEGEVIRTYDAAATAIQVKLLAERLVDLL